MKLRPMSEFDPTRPALVHDELNDRTFESKPEWADSYREAADPRWGSDGKIGWDAPRSRCARPPDDHTAR